MAETTSTPLAQYLATIPELQVARGQFLYSSLPSRKEVNPTGYSGAINWWETTLATLVVKGLVSEHKLILVVDESLREGLRYGKLGRPASLGAVLAESAAKGDYIPLNVFMKAPASVGWVSYLARPVWWTLGAVKNRIVGGAGPDLGEGADERQWNEHKGEWVVRQLVERATATLLPQLPSLHPDVVSRLYTTESWHGKIKSLCLPGVELSEKDCEVLAKHLSDKGLCVRQGEVIKFAPPLGAAKAGSLVITDSDKSTITLLASLRNLTASVTSLEERIAAHTAKASDYVAKKQTTLAKNQLSSRKRLESLLATRLAGRDKLEEVLTAIEKATGDEETLAALSLGTSTLRSILASPNLQLDRIEETTSALSDALQDATEVDEAVNAVGTSQLDATSQQEVDDEFAQLLAEAKQEDEKAAAEEAARKKEAAAKADQERAEKATAEAAKDSAKAHGAEEQTEQARTEEARQSLEKLRLVEEEARLAREGAEREAGIAAAEKGRVAEEEARKARQLVAE